MAQRWHYTAFILSLSKRCFQDGLTALRASLGLEGLHHPGDRLRVLRHRLTVRVPHERRPQTPAGGFIQRVSGDFVDDGGGG